MPDRFFTIGTKPGQVQEIGKYKITPFSQVISFRIPGIKGAAAWIRPVSVLVESEGEEEVMPVLDITRIIGWWLLGFGIGLPLLSVLFNRRR